MEWSYPWLSIDGDRAYDDSDFAQFFANIFSTGVSMTTTDGLKVTTNPTGGMRIQVQSGAANMGGRSYFNSGSTALNIAIASSVQDRFDSVVVRMDKGIREIKLVVKTGDTSVQRSSDIYELQLATIKVPRNASAITADLITDKRADEKVCGYSSPFVKVAVSGLEEQYTEMLQQIINKMNQYTADEKIKFEADMKAILDRGNTQLIDQSKAWQDWFDSIKAELDGDVAGNLLNQINKLKSEEEVFRIQHNLKKYPQVRVTGWLNGFGINKLGESNWLGDSPATIPNTITYPSYNELTVSVPDGWKLLKPVISESTPFNFLLVEGNKSIRIQILEE